MGKKKMSSSLPAKSSDPGLSFIERLESRRLLTQISVASFGAKPNDGSDDTAAIRSAVNASVAGDTVFFPAGTYNISDTIMVKGGRVYKGESGTILKGDPAKHIFHIQQDNTQIQNFTFDGKPIMIDTSSGSVKVAGLVINNNIFHLNSTGTNGSDITFTTGLRNSSITNNTFDAIGSHIALYGYYWDGLTIANNAFLNGTQGIHVDDLNDTSRNLLIEQNIFSGLHRMGIEYQGGGTNTIVQDNWYEKPVMTSNPLDNMETFAFSIVADRSHGTIARRNVIWAPERPDGKGVRIGFETGGDGTLVENNYIYGINQAIANTDGNGTTSCVFQNNYVYQMKSPNGGRNLTQINNGPQVNLQWLIDRGKAGPGRRFTAPANSSGSIQQSSTTSSSQPLVQAVSGTTYLSDLAYTVAANGWGNAEKDRSNGEQGASDGHTITLNGQTYAKGIGVHADSTINYSLNGKYSKFFSDVGVDDEVASKGSVTFQVWLDGVKVYETGKMTGSSATQSINLDVTGKTTLKLVVTSAGDGNGSDHGDWANARLAPLSTATWVSDLSWTSMTNGWGPVEKDRSNGESASGDGKTLSIRSNTYTKGLGTNANSEIRYSLGGKYKTFTSDIGIDNETAGRGTVVFRVYVDGTLAYDSGTVRGTDAVKQVSVNVAGAQELRLVVTNANDGSSFDHADWAGAKLLA